MSISSQRWVLDLLGNWSGGEDAGFSEDVNGDGDFTDAGDVNEERLHNLANELEEIAAAGVTPPLRPFEYDAAGNMSSARQAGSLERLYVHDAWNRLVRVELRDQDAAPGVCVQPYPIAEYEYNALHWRVVKRSDQRAGQACPEAGGVRQHLTERRDLYYDGSWRLLHEEVDDAFDPMATGGGAGADGSFTLTRLAQQVWSGGGAVHRRRGDAALEHGDCRQRPGPERVRGCGDEPVRALGAAHRALHLPGSARSAARAWLWSRSFAGPSSWAVPRLRELTLAITPAGKRRKR